ncbi:hypothetical protein J2T57_001498 [Natronocella acetinitrilica]|uniref:Uncharacterized protein n=1 Tax=Natronocella acetinitrilica TaxID=414046 RepID=A0AAE3G439_9GAMM|nr:hypothetical protein [Natronocella acetinitrilica]
MAERRDRRPGRGGAGAELDPAMAQAIAPWLAEMAAAERARRNRPRVMRLCAWPWAAFTPIDCSGT